MVSVTQEYSKDQLRIAVKKASPWTENDYEQTLEIKLQRHDNNNI